MLDWAVPVGEIPVAEAIESSAWDLSTSVAIILPNSYLLGPEWSLLGLVRTTVVYDIYRFISLVNDFGSSDTYLFLVGSRVSSMRERLTDISMGLKSVFGI